MGFTIFLIIWFGSAYLAAACMTSYCATAYPSICEETYDADRFTGFLIGMLTGVIGLLVIFVMFGIYAKKFVNPLANNPHSKKL